MTMDTKQLRSMSVEALRAAKEKREIAIRRMCGTFYPNVVGGEIAKITRELQRRQPKTVRYSIDDSGVRFDFESKTGTRRRVHPRKPGGATQYPQDLCADEINAWLYREGITHVFADTDDTETSNICLTRGKYTRAQFIKWWRQAESEND